MTDIEKALAMIAPSAFYEINPENVSILVKGFKTAIEQHEAFRQEVSDTVVVVMNMYPGAIPARHLSRFIISKPKSDPLLDIVERLGGEWKPEEYVKEIRAALEARGLEIREKGK